MDMIGQKTKSRAAAAVVSLILFNGIFLQACSTSAPFLVPEKESGQKEKELGSDRVDIQIRPIDTSGFKSKDLDFYHFDFSQFFTAIEIRVHNSTQNPVQWDPFQSILKNGEEKEFQTFNEDGAIDYYKRGELPGDSIVLLQKPYEQQKEDIENIKRFIVKPASVPPGQEAEGLLLFRKVSLNHCENVLLVVAGIQTNHQERKVSFPLKCPKE
ncbi:MAG: hypothetical protein HYR79_03660 [Nitrospirae bacterium]|nr:hypothetical protein [Nitrospirota bacterium]